MFEEIIGGVAVVIAAVLFVLVVDLVVRFWLLNSGTRKKASRAFWPAFFRGSDPGPVEPGLTVPERYLSRGPWPCRCAEFCVPSSGSQLSAGTDEKSRNDDLFTRQGTRSADSSEGKKA